MQEHAVQQPENPDQPEQLAEVIQLPVGETVTGHPAAAELREEATAWQEELDRVKAAGEGETGKAAQTQLEKEWRIQAIIDDRKAKAGRIQAGEDPVAVQAEDEEESVEFRTVQPPIEKAADLDEQIVLHQQELNKVETSIKQKGAMASGKEHMRAHWLSNKVEEFMHRRKRANEAKERMDRLYGSEEAAAEENTGTDAA